MIPRSARKTAKNKSGKTKTKLKTKHVLFNGGGYRYRDFVWSEANMVKDCDKSIFARRPPPLGTVAPRVV